MHLSYRFDDKGYGKELEKIIISPAEADMSILNAVTSGLLFVFAFV